TLDSPFPREPVRRRDRDLDPPPVAGDRGGEGERRVLQLGKIPCALPLGENQEQIGLQSTAGTRGCSFTGQSTTDGQPGFRSAPRGRSEPRGSRAASPAYAAAAVTSAGWPASADRRFISGSSAKEMIAPATATPPSQKYSRM